MIKRLVKLSFRPEFVPEFIALFAKAKPKVMAFPGCRHIELLHDEEQENVFFTFSIWDSEENLDNYRNSPWFFDIWEQMRTGFNDDPHAWSLKNVG